MRDRGVNNHLSDLLIVQLGLPKCVAMDWVSGIQSTNSSLAYPNNNKHFVRLIAKPLVSTLKLKE